MATQYAFGKIVTDGLVLSLDAADRNSYVSGSTTWNDLSGNYRNGTLTNGPIFSETNGGNIVFDGINDLVTVTNNFISADSSITVSTWTKITTGLALVDTINDSVSWDGFGLWSHGANNKFIWYLLKQYSPNIGVSLSSNGSWVAGAWINAVGTYNGSIAAIYLNGALDNSSSYSGGYDVGQANIGIAARPSSLAASNCSIANVSIYNRALSATEIFQNYKTQKARFGL